MIVVQGKICVEVVLFEVVVKVIGMESSVRIG